MYGVQSGGRFVAGLFSTVLLLGLLGCVLAALIMPSLGSLALLVLLAIELVVSVLKLVYLWWMESLLRDYVPPSVRRVR